MLPPVLEANFSIQQRGESLLNSDGGQMTTVHYYEQVWKSEGVYRNYKRKCFVRKNSQFA